MTFDAIEHWNKSHENHPIDRPPSNYGIEKEKLFPINSVICDLGGGDGADSVYFLQQGHFVYLYDISNPALSRARDKINDCEFESNLKTIQADLTKDGIASPSNFFDVLYSRLFVHYFTQERTIEILREIHRVIKDSGTAYVVVKSPKDKNEMKFLKGDSKEIDESVFIDNKDMIKSRFSKEQYKDMLNKAGINNFKINDYKEIFGKQKIYVKSKANSLLYLELTIRKS